MSKVGKLNNNKGFTLLELVVVISIMGTLLFFTLPEFRTSDLLSSEKQSVGNIMNLIKTLKTKAVLKNRDYVLHLSSLTSAAWITDDTMDDETLEKAEKKAIGFSENIRLVDVNYHGIRSEKKEVYDIFFSRHGYCDMALIHFNDGIDDLTILVEPFVTDTRLLKGYVSYDECI